MLHDRNRTMFNHWQTDDAGLLDRINLILARNDLRLASVQPDPITGASAGYEFIYGSRAFHLRVSLQELASSLGIVNEFRRPRDRRPPRE